MNKSISIFDEKIGENKDFFYSRLERDLGTGKKCFNCEFCGDIVTQTGEIKDSIAECLGKHAGIVNIKIYEKCDGHNYLNNYFNLNKGD